MRTKTVMLDFSNGLNEVDHSSLIADNQMANGSYNMSPTRRGLKRRKSFAKVEPASFIGAAIGVTSAVNEKAYVVEEMGVLDYGGSLLESEADINSVDLGIAELADGVVFFQNKKSMTYCEVNSAGAKMYNMGLPIPSFDPPSAVVARAGGLPDGTYLVKVTYTRKTDSFGRYYSRGTAENAVILESGYNAIEITPPPVENQATHFTIWIKSPDESAYYSFGEYFLDDTMFKIENIDNKNTSLSYENEVTGCISPYYDSYSIFTYPYFFTAMTIHNKQLWIVVGYTNKRQIRYSRRATSPADYFKFDDSAFLVNTEFDILCLFSLGEHLYISTEGGLLVLPYGNPSNKLEYVDKNVYFSKPLTLQKYKGSIYGLTNLGVRKFDGNSFSQNLTRYVDTANGESSFIAYDWFDNGEASYHVIGRNISSGAICHLAMNLDRYNDTGEASFIRYDIAGILGFYLDSKTYLTQTRTQSLASSIVAERATTASAVDYKVIKTIAGAELSTAVGFKVYSKRTYLSNNVMMKAREMKILANKTTDNDTECGVTVKIKAYNL